MYVYLGFLAGHKILATRGTYICRGLRELNKKKKKKANIKIIYERREE